MIFKKIKKTTNGLRNQKIIKKNILSKYNNILKKLLKYIPSKGGRNKSGKITVWHKGGASNKKKISILKNNNVYHKALIISTLLDSKRNSLTSLNFNIEKKKFFKTIYLKNILPGYFNICNNKLNNYQLGYRTYLSKLPIGTVISLLNQKKQNKITYIKSSGTFGQIIDKKNEKITLRLPSGKLKNFSNFTYGSIGAIGFKEYKLISLGKAGKNRHKNIRPTVRGVAMNPVDHPHGGRSNKGMQSVTPWGILTKNIKTRKKYE